ncbi:MAG: FAD:protein FMN transferase [Pirellulales bacterium]|nr:FAD:protein FMN transferase [Pirellulales bacterium]
MAKLAIVWVVLGTAASASADGPQPTRFERTGLEMAVPVRLLFYAPDEATANRAAETAFSRFRQLNAIMSDYDAQSELRKLGDLSGDGQFHPVGEDLWRVLAASREFSRQSDGAFDVTVGPVVRLWRRARRQHELPKPVQLAAARRAVGWELIELDEKRRAVRLAAPGMRLDLGGIAKGYAVDEALKAMAAVGVDRALIDAGGDIGLGAAPPDKPGWRIGVIRLEANGPPQHYVVLAHRAIATSGDTWQSVEINGKRYSHLVDPRTGVGLTDHSNVTVIASDATTADALASAVSVLGPEKGLALVDRTPGAAALVLRAPRGKLETYESKRWKVMVARRNEGNGQNERDEGGNRDSPRCVESLTPDPSPESGRGEEGHDSPKED